MFSFRVYIYRWSKRFFYCSQIGVIFTSVIHTFSCLSRKAQFRWGSLSNRYVFCNFAASQCVSQATFTVWSLNWLKISTLKHQLKSEVKYPSTWLRCSVVYNFAWLFFTCEPIFREFKLPLSTSNQRPSSIWS